MLFLLLVFIRACLKGIVITDFTTFAKCVKSMDNIPCLIIAIVLVVFYIYCYFKNGKHKDEEELNDTAIGSVVLYAFMAWIIFLITSNKSLQLCNKIMWAFIVLWPVVILGLIVIEGRIKKVSYIDCLFSFFDLEARMIKYVLKGSVIIMSASLILFYPAALFAENSIGGDYRL